MAEGPLTLLKWMKTGDVKQIVFTPARSGYKRALQNLCGLWEETLQGNV